MPIVYSVCKRCGKIFDFKAYKGRQTRIYCSNKCSSFGRKVPTSKEIREKIRLSHIGKKLSKETCLKISLSNKGKKQTEETKAKMRIAKKGFHKGIPRSEETKRKISIANKGRVFSAEIRKKNSMAHIGINIGNKSPLWKGGRTPKRIKIESSIKYKEWRQKVFIRDNFTCQDCGVKGGYLEAHHKKPFYKLLNEVEKYLPLMDLYDGAMLYEPLWDINNGITLCPKCHRKIKRGGWRGR